MIIIIVFSFPPQTFFLFFEHMICMLKQCIFFQIRLIDSWWIIWWTGWWIQIGSYRWAVIDTSKCVCLMVPNHISESLWRKRIMRTRWYVLRKRECLDLWNSNLLPRCQRYKIYMSNTAFNYVIILLSTFTL